MPIESVSLSFLSIFTLVSFFIFLASLNYSTKIGKTSILDLDFSKPQAFHTKPLPRCGGLALIVSLVVFNIMHYLFFEKIILDYLIISCCFFLLGFLDDIKIRLAPKLRLILMVVILLTVINLFSLYIEKSGLAFLNLWLENTLFKNLFVLLCFLFIVNGSNLIDGFNGLLGIHILIINLILLYINVINGNEELSIILISQIILFFIFFLFNFPSAKMFFGDSGSYLVGSLISINVIKSSNLNPEISPFFFCVILFYLFYEVFFSFFRKIFQKKSPLKPDEIHLHMLIFRKLKKINMKNPNALTGLIMNLMYLSLILPVLFSLVYGQDSALFYRYWFFGLLVIYTLFYARLYKLSK